MSTDPTEQLACPSMGELQEFNSGRLPNPSIARIEHHLQACRQCVERLDTINSGSHGWTLEFGRFDPNAVAGDESIFAETGCRQFLDNAKALANHSTMSLDSGAAAGAAYDPDMPRQIGPFAVLRELGRGGFAVVYLARRPQSDQLVAIKVSRPDGDSDRRVSALAHEAQAVAGLEHEAIVPILESGSADNRPYVVMPYFSGKSLDARMGQGRLPPRQVVKLVARMAAALHFAHKRGFVHRDIKPANILLDGQDRPFLADFGLSLHDDLRWLHRGELAGTRPYMAPEQVRGEAHRLDGRTDIWSLGILFYELLTSRRPFTGADADQLFDEIQYREPKPLRQVDDRIPAELERICLKCIAKRMTDRYLTADDLADDLNQWLRPHDPSPDPDRSAVVPKGLRAFDASDADFFLRLLPGPRDRDGLPESVRFWKTRIEATQGNQAFRVGVLMGPSGSGKSSLVRAGLLPRLAPHVETVFVEGTGTAVAPALKSELARCFPSLEPAVPLSHMLESIRAGHGLESARKLLIVIDQFEHCLMRSGDDEARDLVEALRQCDGTRVQAMLLVRDDFTLLTTNFLDELEEPLQQSHNFAVVEGLGRAHARDVLAEFGRACGAIQDSPDRDQDQFLDEAVEAIVEDEFVSPLRIALLAEMLKNHPWTAATVRDLGGFAEAEVAFLDELLVGPRSHPVLRDQAELVRSVLGVMLPPAGTSIRRPAMTVESIRQELSPPAARETVQRVLKLLDSEVRLLAFSHQQVSAEASAAEEASYQLTHDQLVPLLRRWLITAEKRERPGRARLLLQERADIWAARPEPRRLPSLLEWLEIRISARGRRWNETERRMMRAADRRELRNVLLTGAALGLLILAGWSCYGWIRGRHEAEQVLQAQINLLPLAVSQARTFEPWAARHLRTATTKTAAEQLRAALALLAWKRGSAEDAEFIAESLEAAPREDFLVYRQLVRGRFPHLRRAAERRWQAVTSQGTGTEDDALPEPILRKIRGGGGWVQGDAAIVHSLPALDFVDLATALSDSGFRPSSYRPYLSTLDSSRDAAATNYGPDRVAAGWVRDGRSWRTADQLTSAAVQETDRRYREQGFALHDLCQTSDEPLYAALWVRDEHPEQVRLRFDEPLGEFQAALEARCETEWIDRILFRLGHDNRPRYTSIWRISQQGEPSVAGPYLRFRAAFGELFPGMLCTDARVWDHDPAKVNPVPAELAMQRHGWYLDPEAAAGRTASALTVAQGTYAKYLLDLGRTDAAIDELSAAIDRDATNSRLFQYRTEAFIRQGDVARAQADLDRYSKLSKSASTRELLTLRLALAEDDVESARRQLQQLTRYTPSDSIRLKLARANVLLASRVAPADSAEADDLLAAALTQLSGMEASPVSTATTVLSEPDFDYLRKAAAGRAWLDEAGFGERGLVAWRGSSDQESRLLIADDDTTLQTSGRDLAAQGYTPRSVTAAPVESGLRTVSAWQRSRPTEAEFEQLAGARFKLALTLELVGDPEPLLGILRGDQGRETQNLAITEAYRWGVEATFLARQFLVARTTGDRQGLLSALGHYPLEQVSQPQRDRMVAQVKQQTTDPRSLTQALAKWCLGRWDVPAQPLTAGQFELPTADAERNWYANSLGQTMVLVRNPPRFPMGSPEWETYRGDSETQHWTEIGRSFAIAATETTRAQFARFLQDPRVNKLYFSEQYVPAEDCPQISVNQWDAARFCQWLSEREGLPEEAWCYPDIWEQEEGEAIRLPEDFLHRTGYRLPTAAEWEYACRAGNNAPRYFGELSRLAPAFVCYVANSDYKTHPVASHLPNRWGLFDMLGNVMEWCQDRHGRYETPAYRAYRRDDFGDTVLARGRAAFEVRGGHFQASLPTIRAAERTRAAATTRSHVQGFRVARTLPASNP